ncbi:MAG: DUF2090 domain-containing protein [Candidatus Uhrbacteria bacterium]
MKGYVCPLYILPFDHRSTFAQKLLDFGYPVKEKDKVQVTRYKKIVFDAYELAMKQAHCSSCLGLLVDQEFGSSILKDVKKKQYNFAMPVEASGKKIFNFQFGNQFGHELIKYEPTFAKALVRYNPANKADNVVQLKRLKRLSDFCEKNAQRFMLEVLIPPTESQLKKAKGDQHRFDQKTRPGLMVKIVQEMHQAGIEPDVWKITGVETKKDWEMISKAIRGERKRRAVSIIVLGRGGDKEQVDLWIKTAASTGLVNGFAIGRTIFFKPLEDYRDKKIKRAEAVEQISQNYLRFINLWRENAKNKKDTCVCPM